MKKYLSFGLVIFLLFNLSCAPTSEYLNEGSYTPPSIKIQPRFLYPKTAQEHSNSGISKVKIVIAKTGKVDNASILESTGSKELDSASVDYCKNIIFNPAVRNGQPVYSIMIMDVRFSFWDNNWNADEYVQEVELLYKKLSDAPPSERILLQKEILKRHGEFVHKMQDAINFNYFIGRIISSDLHNHWKTHWNSWPLSFLVYHDFMKRFPDYDSLASVQKLMVKSLKFDLEYINKSKAETAGEKEIILGMIYTFLSQEYPELELENSVFLTRKNSEIVS